MKIDPSTSQVDVKRFADRMLRRLERDGVSLKFPQILEAISAGLEERNWSALCGRLPPDCGQGHPGTSAKPSTAVQPLSTALELALNLQWTWAGQPRIGTIDEHGGGQPYDIVCWHVPDGEGCEASLRLIKVMVGAQACPILLVHAPWLGEQDVGALEDAGRGRVFVLTCPAIDGNPVVDANALRYELEMLFLAACNKVALPRALATPGRDAAALRFLSMQNMRERSVPEQPGKDMALWQGTYSWSYPQPGVEFGPRNRTSPFSWHRDVCHLVVAHPGQGKSMLLDAANLDYMLGGPGVGHLEVTRPRIGMIDVGSGAKPAFALMARVLDPQASGRIQHVGWNIGSAQTINIFDTPLGWRKPGPRDRQNIVYSLMLFLEMASVPLGGLAHGLHELVEQVYATCSDMAYGVAPKPYVAGMDTGVDQALMTLGVELGHDASWWQCTDALFGVGNTSMAMRAQRHAVPNLLDMLSMLESLSRESPRHQTGSRSLDKHKLAEILTLALETYPGLGGPTRLDLGQWDGICVDVSCPNTARIRADWPLSASALLVHHVLLKNLSPDVSGADMVYPDAYQDFYRNRGFDLASRMRPHRLVMDELQRLAYTAVMRQVESDMRWARKSGMGTLFATQDLKMFADQNFDTLAYDIWLLPARQSEKSVADARGLGFPDTVALAIQGNSLGVTASGLVLLRLQEAAEGGFKSYGQCRISLDSRLLWALAAAPGQAMLVDGLARRLGYEGALDVLARRYPNGHRDLVLRTALGLDSRRTDQDGNTHRVSIEGLVDQVIEGLLAEMAGPDLSAQPRPA